MITEATMLHYDHVARFAVAQLQAGESVSRIVELLNVPPLGSRVYLGETLYYLIVERERGIDRDLVDDFVRAWGERGQAIINRAGAVQTTGENGS